MSNVLGTNSAMLYVKDELAVRIPCANYHEKNGLVVHSFLFSLVIIRATARPSKNTSIAAPLKTSRSKNGEAPNSNTLENPWLIDAKSTLGARKVRDFASAL